MLLGWSANGINTGREHLQSVLSLSFFNLLVSAFIYSAVDFSDAHSGAANIASES